MSNIIPFNYNEREIRIVQDEAGEPWWVASDICEALDIGNVPDAMSRLDEDEKLMSVLPISGQGRNMWTINGVPSASLRESPRRA